MKRKLLFCYISAFVTLFGLLLLFDAATGQGQAPTVLLVVNSADDTDGDICHPAHCTLRQAITVANDTPGADTISFDLPASTTITLTNGVLPYITDTLTIDGSTATNLIIGGVGELIFFIDDEGVMDLISLTITNDNYSINGSIENRGILTIKDSAITNNKSLNGGPISNSGSLMIISSTLNNNIADSAGGGVTNSGILTITQSIISNNSATASVALGGGIYNISGTVTINDTIINGNEIIGSAANGGGIYNASGTVTINNSVISDHPLNGLNHNGGGIYNAAGTLVINNTTINGNHAFNGGGIYNGGTITITNSTLHGNTVGYADDTAAYGAGIYNAVGGVMLINNSTISTNEAQFNQSSGGGIYDAGGTITINNSTFSGNIAVSAGGVHLNMDSLLNWSNTIVADSSANQECINDGTVGTNVNNLVEDGTCGAMFSGDPLLGPLANNGGPTATHALLPGSPAVDAGDNPACLATDQRGFFRPADGDENGSAICDIGAFELYPHVFYLPIMLKN